MLRILKYCSFYREAVFFSEGQRFLCSLLSLIINILSFRAREAVLFLELEALFSREAVLFPRDSFYRYGIYIYTILFLFLQDCSEGDCNSPPSHGDHMGHWSLCCEPEHSCVCMDIYHFKLTTGTYIYILSHSVCRLSLSVDICQ